MLWPIRCSTPFPDGDVVYPLQLISRVGVVPSHLQFSLSSSLLAGILFFLLNIPFLLFLLRIPERFFPYFAAMVVMPETFIWFPLESF